MRILFAAVLSACFAFAAHAAPLEIYGRLPTVEQVSVSPDGTKFLYVRPAPTGRAVAVQDIATQKLLRGAFLGQHKLRWVEWAGPNHILIVTSQTGKPKSAIWNFNRGEYYQAQIMDLNTGKFRLVLDGLKDVGNFIHSDPLFLTLDGKPTLIVEGQIFGFDPREALFRVDVETGKAKVIDEGNNKPGVSTRWIVDGAGVPVARTEHDETEGVWRLQLRRNGFWRSVQTLPAPIEAPSVVGLGDQPDTLLVGRNEDGDVRYRRLSLTDGSWGEPLEADGVREFLFDPVSRRLIGIVEGDHERRLRMFDPRDQAAWDRIGRAFPGERIELASWSLDRSKVVVRVQGPKNGNAYVLVDQAANRADIVDDVYEGLTADAIAPSRWISYKAADGLEIQAVLTTPLGREAKNLPLVVLVHGGPQAHDDLAFDWWAQALASRGYAVLQPNFRGSSGYGLKFVQAGYGEWGRKMQSDVSDGVRHLAGQGIVDARRVCVAGASYGGYAALAGVTLEQGIYRCAVSVAGVSDLRRMLDHARSLSWSADNRALRYWRRFMGVERGDEKALDALSPARLAAKAQVPILLVHGKDDTVVPYGQSLVMADALKAAGRPAEFVTLAGEDHWLSRSETRLEMLTAMVKFLETHNPPR